MDERRSLLSIITNTSIHDALMLKLYDEVKYSISFLGL